MRVNKEIPSRVKRTPSWSGVPITLGSDAIMTICVSKMCSSGLAIIQIHNIIVSYIGTVPSCDFQISATYVNQIEINVTKVTSHGLYHLNFVLRRSGLSLSKKKPKPYQIFGLELKKGVMASCVTAWRDVQSSARTAASRRRRGLSSPQRERRQSRRTRGASSPQRVRRFKYTSIRFCRGYTSISSSP